MTVLTSSTREGPAALPPALRGEQGGRAVPAVRDRRVSLRVAFLVGISVLLALVTVTPAVVVLVSGINAVPFGTGFEATLGHWRDMLSSEASRSALVTSFVLLVRIPVSLACALLVAWALVRWTVPGRGVIEFFLWFAFFVPILPLALGWILLADPGYGAINALLAGVGLSWRVDVFSLVGISWVHATASTIPIMTILLRPVLAQLDHSWEEAALVCGARRSVIARRITLPLIAPAVFVAGFAAIIKGLEGFEVEQVLGVPAGIDVFSTRIYGLLTQDPPELGHSMAYSSLMLAFLAVLCVFYLRLSGRYEGVSTMEARGARFGRSKVDWKAWLVTVTMGSYIVIALALPFGMVLMGSFQPLIGFNTGQFTSTHWSEVFQGSLFLNAGRTSLVLGLLVGIGGTAVYLCVARVLWACQLSNPRGVAVLRSLAWLPWGVPGLLLGSAYLGLFLYTPVVKDLYGTMIPLLVVLFVQAMPLGVALLYTALSQLSPSLEEAGQVAGARPFKVFLRIVLPLTRPTIVAVLLFTVMLTLRDIGGTVLLSAPGTRTLPVLMFSYTTQGGLEQASVVATVLVLMALVITFLITRLGQTLGRDLAS